MSAISRNKSERYWPSRQQYCSPVSPSHVGLSPNINGTIAEATEELLDSQALTTGVTPYC